MQRLYMGMTLVMWLWVTADELKGDVCAQGDPVEIGVERDGNADMCCLCNQGGSLLCCDRCPASYHMRCIGEQAKSLPEGEWACPECAVGGRGKSYLAVLNSSRSLCMCRDTCTDSVAQL